MGVSRPSWRRVRFPPPPVDGFRSPSLVEFDSASQGCPQLGVLACMTSLLGVSLTAQMQFVFCVKGAIDMVNSLKIAIVACLLAGTAALGGPATRSQHQER